MTTYIGKFTKAPPERKQYTVDYSKWLDTGETVSTVSFSITATGLVSPAVSTLVINAYLINAAQNAVAFFAEAGDSGETYKVFVTITTSAGQTKEDLIVFNVRAL